MKIKGLPGLYDEEPFNPDKLLGFNLNPNDELTDDDIKKELIRIQKQISSMSNEEIVRYSNPNMVKNLKKQIATQFASLNITESDVERMIADIVRENFAKATVEDVKAMLAISKTMEGIEDLVEEMEMQAKCELEDDDDDHDDDEQELTYNTTLTKQNVTELQFNEALRRVIEFFPADDFYGNDTLGSNAPSPIEFNLNAPTIKFCISDVDEDGSLYFKIFYNDIIYPSVEVLEEISPKFSEWIEKWEIVPELDGDSFVFPISTKGNLEKYKSDPIDELSEFVNIVCDDEHESLFAFINEIEEDANDIKEFIDNYEGISEVVEKAKMLAKQAQRDKFSIYNDFIKRNINSKFIDKCVVPDLDAVHKTFTESGYHHSNILAASQFSGKYYSISLKTINENNLLFDAVSKDESCNAIDLFNKKFPKLKLGSKVNMDKVCDTLLDKSKSVYSGITLDNIGEYVVGATGYIEDLNENYVLIKVMKSTENSKAIPFFMVFVPANEDYWNFIIPTYGNLISDIGPNSLNPDRIPAYVMYNDNFTYNSIQRVKAQLELLMVNKYPEEKIIENIGYVNSYFSQDYYDEFLCLGEFIFYDNVPEAKGFMEEHSIKNRVVNFGIKVPKEFGGKCDEGRFTKELLIEFGDLNRYDFITKNLLKYDKLNNIVYADVNLKLILENIKKWRTE